MTESNRIDQEAALWVVRHRQGPLPSDEQRQFEMWIEDDPRHRGAFVRLSAMRVNLQRLVALSAGKSPQWVGRSGPLSAVRLSRRWAIAAAVALCAVGSGAWLAWDSQGESYVSGIGELRQVSLADGSNMSLNTDTELRVRFSKSVREVQIMRGEALFEVTKDPARPFVVRFGHLSVTALGTAFSVRADDGRVDVIVTEGLVELARADSTPGATADSRRRVSANQRAVVTAARAVEVRPLARGEAERRLAWRSGMVAFDGEPLAEAVAEINRHNRRRIVIDDPALAGRPVLGMFRANDINAFAQTAAAVMGARAVEEGDTIRLETKPAE